MINPAIIVDVDHWKRIGRGKELQFFATDEEVQAWLITSLPQEFEPYYLVGVDKVKEDRVYTDRPFRCKVSDFLGCKHAFDGKRFNYWIYSEVLTDDLFSQSASQFAKLCSYNGLVLLQHGLMIKDRREPSPVLRIGASRIAIVDCVQNLVTGERRLHSEYLKVFRSLYNVIDRQLLYSSIVWDTKGNVATSNLQRWTERAVHMYQAGVPFLNKPGPPLYPTR